MATRKSPLAPLFQRGVIPPFIKAARHEPFDHLDKLGIFNKLIALSEIEGFAERGGLEGNC